MSVAAGLVPASRGIVLHVQHAAVPMDVQLAVAALAGVAASLLLVAAVAAQAQGDVPLALAVAALTGRDLLSVPRWAVYAVAVGLGTALGAAAKLFGIGVFGQERVGLFGQQLLAAQDLAGILVGGLVLFWTGAFLVLPRYREETTDVAGIRRKWALSCLVYTGALLATVPLAAAALYP